MRAFLNGFVAGARFIDALEDEADINHKIDPFAEGVRKAENLEFLQSFSRFGWGGAEEPFNDFAVQFAEVVANLFGIREDMEASQSKSGRANRETRSYFLKQVLLPLLSEAITICMGMV